MIKILNYRPMNKGHLVGYLDVEIEPWKLEVRDLTVWNKDGRAWVNMPAKKYTKDDGSQGFSEVVRFVDSEYKENFRKAVLAALHDHCKKEDHYEHAGDAI